MKALLRAALALVTSTGCLAPQIPTGIADINSAVPRYWNREVTIEGQVIAADAEPLGTTRGTYQLVDDTDRNPIRILTKELPPVGEMVRVTAVVQQDPGNARLPLLREVTRGGVGNPLFFYLMLGSGAVAVMLVGVLAYSLFHRPAVAPAPVAPVIPRERSSLSDDVTQEYRGPRTVAQDDLTMTFEYWGYRIAVVEGPDQGKAVPIGVSPFLIGRGGSRQNHLELSDRTVSRSQAAIRRHPKTGEFTLEHQGGTNETWVDGKPVQVAVLTTGMRLRMGASVVQFQKDAG
ncbi:MAG: FHA domain-containing protein [Gemmatimonadetes bacterium]|nr:FHA domain-containing protein [Gemmatimonadota bacterium]